MEPKLVDQIEKQKNKSKEMISRGKLYTANLAWARFERLRNKAKNGFQNKNFFIKALSPTADAVMRFAITKRVTK